MQQIRIENKDLKLTSNFNMSEFWNCKYGGHIDFDIPSCLVDAQQVLRNFFGPIQITSTIRKSDTFGFHRYIDFTGAIDSIPLNDTIKNIEVFKQECLNYQNGKGSELIKQLRILGIEGFGLESNNCIHLDYRSGKNVVDTDEYGKYIVFSWDKINGSKVYNRKA